MSIQGVRTCGDYMFSGHTVVLTMLNFFITECKSNNTVKHSTHNFPHSLADTPPTFYLIHTVSWVINLFGTFFILAGHEHYSIDVFVGFYISTRMFLYYHSLANNRAIHQGDRHRTRIWFPLFYFFECNVEDIVPNEYAVPFANVYRHVVSLVKRGEQFASGYRHHVLRTLISSIVLTNAAAGQHHNERPDPLDIGTTHLTESNLKFFVVDDKVKLH